VVNGIIKRNEEQIHEELQLVAFCLQGEEFAINIQQVREVLKLTQITPLPQSLYFIEGVINLRGEVIPVVDLRKRFQISDSEKNDNTRIIIVEIDESLVGLIVDSVSEVLHLSAAAVDPPPKRLAGTRTEFIAGVGKLDERLIIILDINRILSTDEQMELEQLQLGEPNTPALGA
jgi:purine-binding chemotaxis protein CheW